MSRQDGSDRMMTHDAAVELVAAYALDVIEVSERGAFEAHLAVCVACQREVAACRAVTVAIGTSTEPMEPPAALRARTLAAATAQPQRPHATAPAPPPAAAPVSRTHWGWLAAAASIVLAIATMMYASSLRFDLSQARAQLSSTSSQISRLRDELADARMAAARLINTVNIMGAPDMIKVGLRGQADAVTARGNVYLSASRGVMFQTEGMPVLPAGKVYQLWLIPKGQTPVSGGVFTVDASGSVSLSMQMPAGMPMPAVVAVTMEDGPTGVVQSQNQPVMVGTAGQ